MNITRILYIACFLIVLLAHGKLMAQTDSQLEKDSAGHKLIHKIGVDIRPGYVTPTSSFFEGNNAHQKKIKQSLSVHLKYAFQFNKDSYLGRMYPYAYQGIGVSYSSFFCTSELQNPVTVYAFQGSRIAQLSPRLSFDYEWNFGASFGWTKYDEENNPRNVVIGSKINAYINLGFLLNWQIRPDWNLTAGVDFTHYSNGNTHYPNAGVNPIGARIGVVHTLGGEAAVSTPGTSLSRDPSVRPHVSYDLVVYGATRKRGLISDSESFLIPGSFGIVGLNFNPMYNFNKYFKAGVSLDAQYDESANIKDYRVEGTFSDNVKFHRPPFREQFAVGVSIRGELVMPIFSINAGIGRNLIYSGEDTKGFYQILALKASVTRHLFLHVGYQLSKFKDPNNLMLGLGYRFHDKRR